MYEFFRRLLRQHREVSPGPADAEGATDDGSDSSELGLLSRQASEAQGRYASVGDLEALQAAVATWQRALAHPDFSSAPLRYRSHALNDLGNALLNRYEATLDVADLDAALERWKEAVALLPTGTEDRSVSLGNLGAGYLVRYTQTSDLADLDRAIHTQEQAMAEGIHSSADRAGSLANLGNALRVRYEQMGRPSDLERAIDVQEQALALTTPDAPSRPLVLIALAGALSNRYERTGDLEDLERSIDAFEQAVESTSPLWPHRVQTLTGLADRLRIRYSRTGQVDDLERAIDVLGPTATQGTAASSDQIGALDVLGNALRDRYQLTGQIGDLKEAVEAFERVVARTQPGSAHRPMFLTNLGNALQDRYLDRGQLDDLEHAISLFEQSVAETPEGSPDLPRALNSLGGSLLIRFERLGEPDDLRRGLSAIESAVATTPADSPQMPAYLNDLANGLRRRYEQTGDPDDLQRAVEAFRRSCRRGLDVSAQWMLGVTRVWGSWATERKSWDEAVEAYGFALTAMRSLFRTQLTRSHRERWLREAAGLPSRAAYALAMTGDLQGAVVALEQGRALLLSDALERDRLDAETLSTLDRPELRFLDPHPPGFEDLVAVASAAPLVYLAAAEPEGLALVAKADGLVTLVRLPGVSESRLRSEVVRYFERYFDAHISETGPSNWQVELDRMTRWLGEVLMEPMLELLSSTTRMVLIPAGLLSLLPLHAAWIEDKARPTGRRYALDLTLLAYAPNARAIQAADSVATRIIPKSALAVEEPQPVSAAPLPHTEQEVEAVLAALPGSRRLRHEQATRAAVLAELRAWPVLHFACHGFANPVEPLSSFLLMADDEPLTLSDVLEQRLAAGLVVLSACDTAVPGVGLPDEVVGLPTGFLQAGAAGVVGSLWSVRDVSTMLIMVRFYQGWRREGLEPAEALRQAQRWARDATNGEKQAAFPDVPALAAPAGSAAMQAFWADARTHEHPYHWAAFTYVGT